MTEYAIKKFFCVIFGILLSFTSSVQACGEQGAMSNASCSLTHQVLDRPNLGFLFNYVAQSGSLAVVGSDGQTTWMCSALLHSRIRRAMTQGMIRSGLNSAINSEEKKE